VVGLRGDGEQEPFGPPYDGFEGHVGRTYTASKPWWPPRPSAAGHPNVLLVVVDDLGFSDLGCFGSEINTPSIDRIAAEGVRLTNFHVAPMCSPTRAALLSGCNPHSVGFGTVANFDPGFPGNSMEFPEDVATVADAFGNAGYATFAVGKWHLCKETDMHDAGSRASWPCSRGVERYYGFLDGFTNFHQPHRLYEDNHALDTDTYPDDYYLTDDLTDRAIGMIRSSLASDPTRPFFCYLAHGAVHAPLQARQEDIDAQRGRYEVGWDTIRTARYARQIELGVIAPDTRLASRNHEPDHDVGAWDDLTLDEQRLFARYMEVYAAMVASVDAELGRLRTELEELGVWDDTIVVFTSDNGASKEGGAAGTTRYLEALSGLPPGEAVTTDLERFDLIGGPQVLAHYPRGWAMASNTPFRLYKVNTHAGGQQVPFIVSWPNGPVDVAAQRNQYEFVTDLYPTLAALADVPIATHRRGSRSGVREIDGRSFAPMLSAEGLDSPSTRTEQYQEMTGHRSYYRDGWEAVTFHRRPSAFGQHEWELYDLRRDPTQIDDLASQHPELVAELADAWERAAWANGVFPIDEGVGLRGTFRPERLELSSPVVVHRGDSLERARSQVFVGGRPFDLRIDVDFAAGDRGVLLAHGDQGCGYSLFVDDDHLWWAHNDLGSLGVHDLGSVPVGTRSIEIAVSAVAGPPVRWDVACTLDGVRAGTITGLAAPTGLTPYQGIDVGADTRSPVHWELFRREGSFAYRGVLHRVRITPGMPLFDREARIEQLRDAGRAYD